jgi:tetratricopeptide (TPR) repeat protein
MARLLRDNANRQGADLVELLADQEDIRHGLEHFADTGQVDLALLQGLTRLVEQTTLGDWHSALLARMRDRLDPDSQMWIGAVLLLQQGKRHLVLGHQEEARAAFERSLEISRALNDQRGEAMVLNSLGGALRALGRLEEARTSFDQSLQICCSLNDRRSKAIVLNSLGGVLRDLGRLEEALAAFDQSLQIGRSLNDWRSEAMVLNGLGAVLRDLGRLEEARTSFDQSLQITRNLNDRRGEAIVLNGLGTVLRNLGRLEEARTAFDQSLQIGRSLNDRRIEARVLSNWGCLKRELGDPDGALDLLEKYRALSKDLGLPLHSFSKNELNTLRKWSKQLVAGTHTFAEYHRAMEQRCASAKDWHGAIIHIQRNLALDLDEPELCKQIERLGHAYFRAKRLPEAIDAYRSVLEIGPLSSGGCATFGRALHLAGGDLSEAEIQLREACRLQPDNAWAHSWLGLLLAETGQLDEGERQARQALVGDTPPVVFLYNLAKVLAQYADTRRDKLQESLDTYTRANAHNDAPPSWTEILVGELRERLGNPEAVTSDNASTSGLSA